ncbi:hypothetical protein JNUCC0626_00260 [Lentzea sp. JNUCC 0626]
MLLAYCRLSLAERQHMIALYVEAQDKGFILFADDGVPIYFGH